MKTPITQSKLWQDFQKQLGTEVFFEKKSDYQFLAIQKSTPIGNYLYLPYGPVAKDQKSFKEALRAVTKIAKAKKAVFIRIEPQNPDFIKALPKNTAKTRDLSPKETWVLDLSPSRESIILGFSHGVRNPYNTAQKRGLIVENTKDESAIAHLVRLQQDLAKTKHLHTYSEDYLKAELRQPFAFLSLVKYQRPEQVASSPDLPQDGQVLAASLFFDYAGTRYYMQSASDNRYKKLPATVVLLATAIMDAKAKGIKQFDFWGIAPEGADPSHPWYGFTKFKKSFGGHEVQYAGTYDMVLNPLKYKLYQSTRFLGRIFHHQV
ncbi:peptidoglycan bridge formation glycyltransferase FemA/FemB family protein [Candidatus Saccharibacteria bacterium]|nr:peptidoglycan bridge formation glycyltransferase FemA/FemB family protein [Candidatus Saccharibacteria bacterium]